MFPRSMQSANARLTDGSKIFTVTGCTFGTSPIPVVVCSSSSVPVQGSARYGHSVALALHDIRPRGRSCREAYWDS
jgi:hypothetical protein